MLLFQQRGLKSLGGCVLCVFYSTFFTQAQEAHSSTHISNESVVLNMLSFSTTTYCTKVINVMTWYVIYGTTVPVYSVIITWYTLFKRPKPIASFIWTVLFFRMPDLLLLSFIYVNHNVNGRCKWEKLFINCVFIYSQKHLQLTTFWDFFHDSQSAGILLLELTQLHFLKQFLFTNVVSK